MAFSIYLLKSIPLESLFDMICKSNNFSKGEPREIQRTKTLFLLSWDHTFSLL